MTQLILVRHGETIWHAENRYAGSSDIELTALGHAQAQELAQWAATAKLDALWVSPLRRAHDTAAPVAAVTGLTPMVDARLREVDFGETEGHSLAALAQRAPEAAAAFQADPVTHHMPGGEDPREAAQRAVACLWDIAEAHPQGRVLVVGHGTLMRLAICQLLDIDLSRYRKVFPRVENVAKTELRLRPRKPPEASDHRDAALIRFNG